MDTPSIILLVSIALLICCSAFFSATETAFSALNLIRLKNKAENGNKRAALTLRLAEDYDKLLSTILIGNNIVNIAAASLGTVFFVVFFPRYGATISTVVLTVVVLMFGEVSPKSLAKERPEAFAMFAAPVVRVLMFVMTPLNFFFAHWKKLISKLLRGSADDGITEEELTAMVEQAEDQGGLDENESQLIRAAIEFNELEVGEILTPRVDLTAVPDTISMEELAALFAETGYSRLPVYHESIDAVIGVIHEKDFYSARYHGAENISGVLGEVIFSTDNTKISELMRILQKSKTHMVVVVDEYGGTEGIVTLEDILEELVGEIWDETDEVIEQFKKQEDGSYLISCSADLTDLYDLFSVTGDYDSATVAGWVMEEIGRIPAVGDSFTYENLDVTVTKIDHRRVIEIQVVVQPQPEEPAGK
ncbi:MAG: hemolysin family protein [Oscillospiraceae bacterium]